MTSKSTSGQAGESGTPRTAAEMKYDGAHMDGAVQTPDDGRPAVGESTDPRIHQLLAQRQGAEHNGDTDMIKGIDQQLAELGYTR
jgi:hypothetical protein